MRYRKNNIKTVFVLCTLCLGLSAQSQELETLIDVALNNNPEIQKFEFKYKRASEKANEVNTIPNTEFGVGYFMSEPETRTDYYAG